MKGLIEILQKDKNKKLILELTPLEDKAIHTPTQEIYNELMRVYEVGRWKWRDSKDFPTKHNFWKEFKEETYVSAGFNLGGNCYFSYGYLALGLNLNYKIISLEKFYKIQKITPDIIKEINEYFEKKEKKKFKLRC